MANYPHTRDPHDFGEETYVHWLDKNGFPGRDVDVHPGQWVVRVGHTFTVLSHGDFTDTFVEDSTYDHSASTEASVNE